MSDKTPRSLKSSNKKWYDDKSIQLALLGLTGTIIAALITVLPQLLNNRQKPEPTQTPIIWTATIVASPKATREPALSTETLIPTPTSTATLSPTPTPITPPISCLDRWQVISSEPDLAEVTSQGNCNQANVPGLGISSSQNGLSIGVNNFQKQGTFGIATSLPTAATITMQVDLNLLTQGEFWIALSNTPNPENNMMILAMEPKTGEVRIYNDQTSRYNLKYEWSQLLANTSLTASSPHIYKITFAINGNSVSPQIYFTDLPSQIVNLPKYLFIGYNNKSTLGSMTLQAEISDLNFEK
jgi:hypothetical protein